MYYITSSAGREIAKMRLGNVVQKVGRACSYLSTAAVYHPAHNMRAKQLDELQATSEGLIQLEPDCILGQLCGETMTN